MKSPAAPQHLLWTLVCLSTLLGWDATGLDLAMAHWFGNASGFGLREHWLLGAVLHDGARRLVWLPALWLVAGVWWPTGVLNRLDRRQRLQLVVSTLAGLLAVSLLKQTSRSSCPWDLEAFGGVARYVSHWRWGVADSGSGRCFPAGHASAGFAFVGGYFALCRDAPRQARIWLASALISGLVLGLAQQARGAHYMSHTAWTAWFCWASAWALDIAMRRVGRRHGAPSRPPKPPTTTTGAAGRENPAPLAAPARAS
ncbi:MAG TPA: phosphatase PAP2 family protein [Burkholderiaceae bacterium]|nr:phosphatase PAP2 family protein [Burkholderiaceae bacterium]